MRACPAFLTVATLTLALAACGDFGSPTEPAARASLSGVVRDTDGAPMTHFHVVCQGKRVNSDPEGAAAGAYALGGLAPMPSTVEVFQGGVRAPATFSVDLRPGRNGADFVVERHRAEPASISGVVRATSGRAIAGMKIWCQGRSADVAPDGSYDLEGIVSGWWYVELTWDAYGEHGEELDLAAGANSRDFTVNY